MSIYLFEKEAIAKQHIHLLYGVARKNYYCL